MLPRSSSQGIRDERVIAAAGILAAALLLVAIGVFVDSSIRSWTTRDLLRRSTILWSAVRTDLTASDDESMSKRFEALAEDDRVVGLILCSPRRSIASHELGRDLDCQSPIVRVAIAAPQTQMSGRMGSKEVAVTAYRSDARDEYVVIVLDRSVLGNRRRGVLVTTAAAIVVAVTGLALLLYYGARVTRRRVSDSIREVVRKAADGEHVGDVPAELRPIVRDLDDTVRRLRNERLKKEKPSGPERLRQLIAERMPDTRLVLVANREPYIHQRLDGGVKLIRPASGLVTGVEPLLRACGGVWVAHGSGTADRESSDAKGRLAVPPNDPEYILRRVWLTTEEEDGYYYGFSNEGLWPLCHIAHTRPSFRASDWEQYVKVNRKFAEAAVEESEGHGVFLIQDYHFALAPRDIRRLMPEAVTGLFWHIPWPNAEVVGICPWKRELLVGMLGADVIGFHTRYHCLNFLDTVSNYLEARVDLETMSVEHQGNITRVRPYPISVEWPYPAATREDGAALRRELGIDPATFVVLGVDRADYTKGLLERVDAIESLLAQHPELAGRFLFFQIAAPTRTRITKYRDLMVEVQDAVKRVNDRFGRGEWKPIVLKLEHFEPDAVRRAYAMADAALITPLHDGMNLVAKEYAASCADERGVLILSIFAGAAKELEGALLVNPYDAKDVAEAIHRAITMPESEKIERMRRMRAVIEKRTIFDWSAALLRDLAEVWERRSIAWSAGSR